MALEPVLIKEFMPLGWLLEKLTKLSWHHPDMVTTALGRLLSEDRDLRWAMIVEAYIELYQKKPDVLMGMPLLRCMAAK